MEHSGLFQEAIELILNSNDKFTNRLQKNSVFGSSEDSDELTQLTQCISYVMKTFFEADEYMIAIWRDIYDKVDKKEGYELMAMISLGVPEDDTVKSTPRKPLDEVVTFID